MRIVVYHKDPGPPNGWKYRLLAWYQYDLPKLVVAFGFISFGILVAGLALEFSHSTPELDFTWFQRSGAVVVGWSLFIGILERSTVTHRSALKGIPQTPELDLRPLIAEKRSQAFRLSIVEAASLLFGTLVWAFGDMITNRFFHCGEWLCG